jgi:Secretion system C-terminal sorting domain
MKKLLFLLLLVIGFNHTDTKAQCPPGAFAYQSLYPQCTSGCGVLLLGWPEGVLVNIYGGSPLIIITSTTISGTLGNGGTGDAFTCVPCNTPLVYASATPGAIGGCVIATIGIVPVKITNFSVSLNSGTALIKWSTSLETGPVKYTVQRSGNGRDYRDIAIFDGTHLPLNNNYSYNDATAGNGANFYRIKIAEISGNIFYSETGLVKNDNAFGFNVYPNPTANEFKLTLQAKFLPAAVEIINAQGKLLYKERLEVASSTFNKALPKGIYAVKVTGSNNNTITQRLIKN